MKKFLVVTLSALMIFVGISAANAGSSRGPDGRLKVLYHIDSSDIKTVMYAMALIKKHIEAEGGMDKIDIKVVIHGPALLLFDKETVDLGLKEKLKLIIDKGVQPEMCQVSMKLFNKPLDALTPGFKPTAHPVAVKRIADLQEEGYIYIKP